MRTLITSLIFILFSLHSYSQKTDTVWLNSKWEKSVKEKSSYYRIITTSKDNSNYTVADYYITGEIQMKGNYLRLDTPQIRNGEFLWWYRNGAKKATIIYDNDKVKKEIDWDVNGKITSQYENIRVMRSENGKQTEEIVSIEVAPQFPGGMSALHQYISDHVRYPAELTIKPKGKILVGFTITDKGKVIDAVIVQSLDPLLDKEILRVVKTLPRFAPGIVNGKATNIKFSLPVSFNGL